MKSRKTIPQYRPTQINLSLTEDQAQYILQLITRDITPWPGGWGTGFKKEWLQTIPTPICNQIKNQIPQ